MDQEIANILYNVCLDLDYRDYIEFADQELEELAKEIQTARELKLDCLINVLEIIAAQQEDLKNWHMK